jgi:hypothetical protein
MNTRAVAAAVLGVLVGVALIVGVGSPGRFVVYAAVVAFVAVTLILGRRGRLRSRGRTLDLTMLGSRMAAAEQIADRTYWIPREAVVTALDGKQVVPLFTSEQAARAWPGEGDAAQTSGSTVAAALSAIGVEAAAVDPSSLEELRRGPDARDPSARTVWIRLGDE